MADVVTLPARPRLAVASAGDGPPPIADRLAQLLEQIVTDPLVKLTEGRPAHLPLELRLTDFNPELAERAAALLEEAGW